MFLEDLNIIKPSTFGPYTTIQAAVNAALVSVPPSAVYIPAGYAGTDTYSNASNVPVFDLRPAALNTGSNVKVNAGLTILSAGSPALAPSVPSTYVVTKGSIAAMTLAAPVVTVDDGKEITVTSNTAFAHSITATGLLQTGTSSVNSITFPALAGASVTLMAYQGKWNVISQGSGTYTLA